MKSYALSPSLSQLSHSQTVTPCPQIRNKRKKENQPLSDDLPSLTNPNVKRNFIGLVEALQINSHSYLMRYEMWIRRKTRSMAYPFELVIVWFYGSGLTNKRAQTAVLLTDFKVFVCGGSFGGGIMDRIYDDASINTRSIYLVLLGETCDGWNSEIL